MKKILIITLLMSVCLGGFSKKNEKEKVFLSKKEAIDAAKMKLKDKVEKELLIRMKSKLATKKGDKPAWSKKLNKSDQFLYDKTKLSNIGNNIELKKTFDKLIEKKFPTTLVYDSLQPLKENIDEEKKKNIYYRIPVFFEVCTETSDKTSKAKYNVTLYYKVKIIKEQVQANKTDKKNDGFKIGSMEFIKSDVKAISFFSSEKKIMRQNAINAIVDWYKELPKNLDVEYTNKTIGEILPNNNITGNDIKNLNFSKDYKTFTADIDEKGIIKIAIDPEIALEDTIYYTDLTASLELVPSFTGKFKSDLTVKKPLVVNIKKTENRPITNGEKVARKDKAHSTMEAFRNNLSEYVGNNNKECKNVLLSMFVSPKKNVQVSHRTKYNKTEKINRREAQQYLNRLKGNSLNVINYKMITESVPELNLEFDPNLNTVMFLMDQQYDGKTYKDGTEKIVFMKHQDDDSYLIDKIEVVPNSTNPQ